MLKNSPVESGVNGGLAISFNGSTSTSFQLPFQSLRAGCAPSDAVSLEPVVSVNYLKFEEIDAIYALGLEFGALLHVISDRSRSRPYFRPFARLQLLAAGGESVSQSNVGGGFGVKVPVANQLAVRLEAGFQHEFENEDLPAYPLATSPASGRLVCLRSIQGSVRVLPNPTPGPYVLLIP